VVASPIALAHSDGIYNPGANSVGDTQGIDSAGAAAAPSVDPATTAWVAQVVTNGGSVGATRKGVVDTFIKCLKTNSLFTTLDRYWLLAGENTQSGLTDMVGLTHAYRVHQKPRHSHNSCNPSHNQPPQIPSSSPAPVESMTPA
jgi:hypothetical protein